MNCAWRLRGVKTHCRLKFRQPKCFLNNDSHFQIGPEQSHEGHVVYNCTDLKKNVSAVTFYAINRKYIADKA